MRTIPVLMRVVDMKTGEVVKEKVAQFMVAPPDTRDGKCPECAVKHDQSEPHNAQRLAYQYDFYARFHRWPTWADAIAHRSPEVQAAWKAALMELGAWTDETTQVRAFDGDTGEEIKSAE